MNLQYRTLARRSPYGIGKRKERARALSGSAVGGPEGGNVPNFSSRCVDLLRSGDFSPRIRQGQLVSVGEDSEQSRQLFDAHLELCDRAVAAFERRFSQFVQREELLGFARVGLMQASRRFEPEQQVPFKGFAALRIRGAIIDGVRQMGSLPRRLYQQLRAYESAHVYASGTLEDAHAPLPQNTPLAAQERRLKDYLAGMATSIALGMVASEAPAPEAPRPAAPDELVASVQLLRLVEEELDCLTSVEAELVRRHYLGEEPLDVISRDLGYSKSWGSRLHSRAMQKLAKRMQARL